MYRSPDNLQTSPPDLPQVAALCQELHTSGSLLELRDKVRMDSLLSCMVAPTRDESIDIACRLGMLEIIELR